MAVSDALDDVWASLETEVSDAQIDDAVSEAGPGQVVCRECACAFGQITEQHLRTHDMTLGEYEAAHPGAPIYPDAPGRQPGRDPGFDHEAETKRKIAEAARRNHDQGAYE